MQFRIRFDVSSTVLRWPGRPRLRSLYAAASIGARTVWVQRWYDVRPGAAPGRARWTCGIRRDVAAVAKGAR